MGTSKHGLGGSCDMVTKCRIDRRGRDPCLIGHNVSDHGLATYGMSNHEVSRVHTMEAQVYIVVTGFALSWVVILDRSNDTTMSM